MSSRLGYMACSMVTGAPQCPSGPKKNFQETFRRQLLAALKQDLSKRNFGGVPKEVAALCEAMQMTFLALDLEMQTERSLSSMRKIYKKAQKQVDKDHIATMDVQKIFASKFEGRHNDSEEDSASVTETLTRLKSTSTLVPDSSDSSDTANETCGTGGGDVTQAMEGDDDNDGESWEASETTSDESGDEMQDEDEDDGDARKVEWSADCCGSTAVVAAFVKGLKGQPNYLIVANAGDSRGVLSRGGLALALSEDHKPQMESEELRIQGAGGKVMNGRVDGNLNLSRSLGDLFYKSDRGRYPEAQKITAFPDVKVVELIEEDDFCILACDGIWDRMSNQYAVDFVRQKERRG
eukprot:GHVN01016200.1.p1 GENE.GHVN01016200.1~~GHVN01016200.1.p1  ORF type:complete len:351 (+),score=77.79 GHVN01016200.1:732-1784(+)